MWCGLLYYIVTRTTLFCLGIIKSIYERIAVKDDVLLKKL